MSQIQSRKLEHIHTLLEDKESYRNKGCFDALELTHCALPEIDFDDVDPSVFFMGKNLAAPLLISSMTGGQDEELIKINQNLALAAEKEQVALAVGSMRVALEGGEKSKRSFQLRHLAPSTVLLANLGAVQLNYGFGIDQCRQLVDLLKADALILHLNPLQEVIQPEGNRCFSGLYKKIETLALKLEVPLIIKEVGSGFSLETLQRLKSIGIKWVDLAGRGGTSWSRVEATRGKEQAGFTYQDWGLSPLDTLIQAKKANLQINLIASGGIRHGLDIVKAIVLGSSLGALARPLLEPALKSDKEVAALIELLKHEIKVGMFLLGKIKIEDLRSNSSLIHRLREEGCNPFEDGCP